MGIKTQKVLRFISKTILLVIGFVLIGYVGLVVYKSIINKPQRVRVTNVTDSAATITWVTDSPVRGVVYYNVKDSVLPGPLGFLFSNVGYDDRDFAVAQLACVEEFNENAKNTKDENFAVSGSNFDCENIKVQKLGAYYTHSVTLKNLNESNTYFFKVGNGIWSWDISGVGKDVSENDLPLATKFNFVTGKVSTTVPTPNIAYGNVVAKLRYSEGEGEAYYEDLSKDSLVFSYLEINDQKSQIISSVTNSSGGWILDKSNFRDTDGNLITDLSKATMRVCAQYEDVETRGCVEALGDLTEDTELEIMGNRESDLTDVEKSRILEKFEELIGRVYAADPPYPVCTGCSCDYDGAKYTSGGSSGTSGCKIPFSSSVGKCTGTKNNYPIEKWFSLVSWSDQLPDYCSSGSTDEAICGGKVVSIDSICSQADPQGCGAPTGAGAGHVQKIKDKKASCGNGGGGGGEQGSCNASNVSACKNGKRCEHDGNDYGWETDATCTSDDPCGGVAHNTCNNMKTKKCVNNDEGWELVTVTNASQCSTGGGGGDDDKIYCSDGTTEVGHCTVGGLKCTVKGGALGASNDCKCKDVNNNLIAIGQCIGITKHTCALQSDGKVGPSVATFVHCPGTESEVPPEVEQCTIVAHYNNRGDLLTCTVKCAASTKELGKAKCIEFGKGSIKESNGAGFSTDESVDVVVAEIDLKALANNPVVLGGMLEESEGLTAIVEQTMTDLDETHSVGGCALWKYPDFNVFWNYCKALGGEPKSVETGCPGTQQKVTCKMPPPPASMKEFDFQYVLKTYAEDNASDGYTLYLPEYGMYSFELGDYELDTEVNNGETYYIFYIEANGESGFQMPEDPENPTAEEDIMLKSSSAQITHKKVSSAQKYEIVKGINIISFDFVPVATDLGAYSASDVIAQAKKDSVSIKYISTFDGGRWNNGYSCSSTPCTGNDFTIVPGKGYLVYATTEGDITIPGYNLTSPVPIAFSAGWNLIGVHGYKTAYTAKSFIDSVNTIKGLTANNVSWWPTSKAKYEGLQVDGSTEYGLDFPISPDNGYFVRISKFEPSDTKCKSLIWHIGGSLNGTCGNTK